MNLAQQYRRFKRWTSVWGTNHVCTFCKRPLRKFEEAGLDVPVLEKFQVIGGGKRQNARCFVCGSMDRERLIYSYLKFKTDAMLSHTKWLHLAPEPVLMRVLRENKHIDYLTGDLKSPRADVLMDITALPFADNSFDVLIANHILEHVNNDHLAMQEIFRVLKPNSGFALLQVPLALGLETTYEDENITDEQARLEHFGQQDHVRLYGKDYPSKLVDAGFNVEEFEWNNDVRLNPNNSNRYGLIENERLFVARKVIT